MLELSKPKGCLDVQRHCTRRLCTAHNIGLPKCCAHLAIITSDGLRNSLRDRSLLGACFSALQEHVCVPPSALRLGEYASIERITITHFSTC
jgi:hypothetical protein